MGVPGEEVVEVGEVVGVEGVEGVGEGVDRRVQGAGVEAAGEVEEGGEEGEAGGRRRRSSRVGRIGCRAGGRGRRRAGVGEGGAAAVGAVVGVAGEGAAAAGARRLDMIREEGFYMAVCFKLAVDARKIGSDFGMHRRCYCRLRIASCARCRSFVSCCSLLAGGVLKYIYVSFCCSSKRQTAQVCSKQQEFAQWRTNSNTVTQRGIMASHRSLYAALVLLFVVGGALAAHKAAEPTQASIGTHPHTPQALITKAKASSAIEYYVQRSTASRPLAICCAVDPWVVLFLLPTAKGVAMGTKGAKCLRHDTSMKHTCRPSGPASVFAPSLSA